MISRQHAETTLDELVGETCSRLLAVPGDSASEVLVCYLEAASHSHRFFLDAGLLFWREGVAPDSEEDLAEGQDYVDIGTASGLSGQKLKRISMQAGVLRIESEDGHAIELVGCDGASRLRMDEGGET